MTPDDVVPFEMGANDRIADEQLERFVEDLRSSFPAQAPAEAETHLAAMFEAAHLLADKGDPAVRPVSNADAPASQVSRLPKRRSSGMMDRKFLRSRGVRVLAPAIAAFTILGAMASANALPRSMQHAAATAASVVGVDLPDGEDSPDVEDPADATTPDAFGTTTDPQDQTDGTSQDDQGQDTQDSTDTTSQDNQGEDSQDSTDTSTQDDQGEDTQDSTDTTSQDNQGEDTQDSNDASTSGDQSGDSQDSGGETSQDSGSSGSDGQSSDSGDSSGDGSGDSSGDGGN